MVLWLYGLMVLWFMASWFYGFTVLIVCWLDGFMFLWLYGFMVLWFYGVMASWLQKLQSFHFMFVYSYWSHIQDFQDVVSNLRVFFGAHLFQIDKHGFPYF